MTDTSPENPNIFIFQYENMTKKKIENVYHITHNHPRTEHNLRDAITSEKASSMDFSLAFNNVFSH